MKAYCCCWSSLQQPTKYKKRNPNGVQRSVTYFLYSPICILQVVGENSNNNKFVYQGFRWYLSILTENANVS